MKQSAPAVCLTIVLAAALCCAPLVSAQTPPDRSAAARREALLAAAREIMQTARYCAVITVDESGRPQARTIDAFPPEAGMVVWFATNPKTRKVGQIRRDPRITLYYFDPHAPQLGYVTLLGRARLVDDAAEKKKRWKPEWAKLWPDRDASYLLVEVMPDRIEVVSPKSGINSDPTTWSPPAVEFPREKRD